MDSFYKALGEEGCKKIEAVASDGARGYLSSPTENARQALIVLDHFHIKKYLNDAVDTVRKQEFFLSASSVRAILHEQGLGNGRTGRRRGGAGVKPHRPDELTGANQCWCWDIGYLKIDILLVFWYLYVVIDEWSRKVIAWRVSRILAHREALGLLDDGIIQERWGAGR